MPGRPRKIAKTVTEMEADAMSLYMGIFVCCAQRGYLENPTADPQCQTWMDALDEAAMMSLALEKLGNMLREKAEITAPGPWEAVVADDDAIGPYEPPSNEWSLIRESIARAVERLELLAGRPESMAVRAEPTEAETVAEGC